MLQLGGRLSVPGSEGFDVLLEALDLESGVWAPTVNGDASGAGIIIAESAADDLGVKVGDTVELSHPTRDGTGFVTTTDSVKVVGIHPSPFRFNVYLDRSLLAAFGAEGLTNELFVVPAEGYTTDDVERELFDLPGVSSVLPAATSSQIVRDSLEEFTAVFQVAEAFMLLLVLLIAYNATSINADERARERATLFAFGLPVRRVMALEIVEGLMYGLLGTIVGLGLGCMDRPLAHDQCAVVDDARHDARHHRQRPDRAHRRRARGDRRRCRPAAHAAPTAADGRAGHAAGGRVTLGSCRSSRSAPRPSSRQRITRVVSLTSDLRCSC